MIKILQNNINLLLKVLIAFSYCKNVSEFKSISGLKDSEKDENKIENYFYFGLFLIFVICASYFYIKNKKKLFDLSQLVLNESLPRSNAYLINLNRQSFSSVSSETSDVLSISESVNSFKFILNPPENYFDLKEIIE